MPKNSNNQPNNSGDNTLDEAHTQRLHRHIVRALRIKPLTFCETIRVSAGAYPAEVQGALNVLVATEQVRETNGVFSVPGWAKPSLPEIDYSRQSSSDLVLRDKSRVSSRSSTATFADPHPADYDWRYTSASIVELKSRLGSIVERGGRIALFGATTLFLSLAVSTPHVVLFDRSASRLKDIESIGFKTGLIRHDLFDPIPDANREYDVVVADPPWYPEFHRAFILRSTQLLRDEGLLFLSVLPWLTRPSAIADRADIVKFALRSGFDLTEVVSGILGYESPKFERIALKKNRITCGDWRFGDLFVFRRINEPSPDLAIERPVDEPEWEEYRFGNRKIKVRLRPEHSTIRFCFAPATGISPIFEGVSRRSPFRSRIDLWILITLLIRLKDWKFCGSLSGGWKTVIILS